MKYQTKFLIQTPFLFNLVINETSKSDATDHYYTANLKSSITFNIHKWKHCSAIRKYEYPIISPTVYDLFYRNELTFPIKNKLSQDLKYYTQMYKLDQTSTNISINRMICNMFTSILKNNQDLDIQSLIDHINNHILKSFNQFDINNNIISNIDPKLIKEIDDLKNIQKSVQSMLDVRLLTLKNKLSELESKLDWNRTSEI